MQELLGHRNVSTTQNYLDVNYADARQACEAIALQKSHDPDHRDGALLQNSESYRIPKTYNSLDTIDEDALLLERARRGYDLTKLRENETTAEIVKIG